MDAETYVGEDQFNRIQGAMFTIENKKFSIYKGVNIIGRNRTAAVNIKNLNVSQHHAMIIIVDDSQHYVSDLNSSNGTYLFDDKITPFKLYEISNGTEIKFGDVTGSYAKLPHTNTTVHLEAGPMEVTQNFTQTFYAAQTQVISDDSSLNQTVANNSQQDIRDVLPSVSSAETQDIHEAATQVVIYPPTYNGNMNKNAVNTEEVIMDIHNAPTQVVTNEQPSTSKAYVENIHEAATQLMTYPQTLTNSKRQEENIHEMATQVVNYLPERDVIDEEQEQNTNPTNSIGSDKANETKENSVHFDSVIEETVIEESVMEEGPSNVTEKPVQMKDDENSNESVDFLTINRPPDIEQRTQHILCQNDSEESSTILNTQDVGRPTKRPVRKLSSSESLLESQNDNQICNSDSETDIENMNTTKSKRSLRMISSSQSDTESTITNGKLKPKGKVIDSDSETDIEDCEIRNILARNKKGINKVKNNMPKGSNEVDNSETDIEDNNDISVAQNYINKNRTKKKRLLSSSQSDIQAKTSNISSEQSSEVKIRRRFSKARVISSDSETDLEDDNIKNVSLSKNPAGRKLHSDSETDIEDIKEDARDAGHKPGINSDSDTDVEDKEMPSARNENCNTTGGLNDTDYIPATQDAFANVFQYSTSKTSNSNRNSENVSSEESFKLGLTELMIDENDLTDRSGSKNKKSRENSPIFSRNLDEMKNASQKNKVDKQQKISSNDSDIDEGKRTKTSSEVNYTVTETEDDSYSIKTQKIEDNLFTKKKENEVEIQNSGRTASPTISREKHAEDIYMLATQKISNVDSVPSCSNYQKNKADDDIYMMATQKVCNTQKSDMPVTEKDDENVYILPTQIMMNDKMPSKQREADNDKDEVYLLPTQILNEKETDFKVPQKFTFKKKTANLDGSLTTILGKATTGDPYLLDTQDIDEVSECSKTDVAALNDLTQSGENNENVDDVYQQPTQELISASKMQMDPYLAETQKAKDDSVNKNDTVESDGKKVIAEKIYVMETHTELYMSANQKIAVQSASCSGSSGQNEGDDVPTQPMVHFLEDFPIKRNEMSPKRVKKCDIESLKKTIESHKFKESEPVSHGNDTDLDRPETLSQIEAFIKKPLTNYSENGGNLGVYDTPTQPLVNLLTESPSKSNTEVDSNIANLKRSGEDSLYSPKMKRVKKSDIENLKKTIGFNKPEETENDEHDVDIDRPETLSQIETFIKKPLRTYKPVRKNSESRYLTAKSIENDILQGSETLSQIEAFVTKPLDKMDNLPKMSVNEGGPSPHHEEDKPETLSQIERFIKKPLNPRQSTRVSNIKRGKASTSKASNETITHDSCSTAISRVELEKVLKNSPKRNKGKRSRIEDNDNEEKSKLKAMESEKSISSKESSDDSLNINSDAGSNKRSEQDTVKRDIDQSFALLEAKSTRTRKSQRVTNVEEVKVALRKNRRSMAVSSVTELAENEGTKKKPSTRKSRIVLNNNTEPPSEISASAKSDRNIKIKGKPESSESNFSEPEVPAKVIRMSTAKKGQTNTKMANTNQPKKEEVPVPTVSKIRVSARMRAANSEDMKSSESESSTSNYPIPETPSRRGRKPNRDVESTPSTSKAKINSKVKNRSDGSAESSNCDSESVNSGDFVLSTPSRRGRSTALNDTALSMSERSKRKLRPKVVFTMLDSPQLESLIRHLGGSIVDSVDACTVLVTEHVKRSQKLLTAVGQGKPICSPEWIRASKKANEFLDPWDFILVDKEAESKWNFSLKDSISRAANEKLLTNYTFHLMVSAAADVLKGSIEACGGKCVKTSPKNVEGFLVVVTSPDNRSKYLKIKKQNPEATIVEPEAVFDGVLRQELRLGRHLLT